MKKIPDEAKKVFAGLLFDVYQWQQEMFDKSYATFERLWRQDTVDVIAVVDGKIAITRQEQPRLKECYTLIGGKVERNEEPLVAAKRELLEESGMSSDSWELFKVYDINDKIDWDVYVYIAHDCKKVQEPNLDPGEKIDIELLEFDEFLDKVSGENFWGSYLTIEALRMKLDNKKKSEFKERLGI